MGIKYDFPTCFSHWGVEENEAIDRVRKSDHWTMAGEVEALEHEFAAYHGRKHCIMVNSGSSANLVMVRAARGFVADANMALVPALAWATTYAPIMQTPMLMELADCSDDWNANMATTRNSYDLVMGVSILGNPAKFDAIYPDCIFLEDNCESLGARNEHGRLCGTYGVMSSFSFFYSHQLSAIEGGAILTDDDDLARTCRLLRNHGWTKGEGKTFGDEYRFVLPGYNLRPLELHAAIAREQLKKLDAMAEERRDNWRCFSAVSHGLPIKMQQITSPGFNPFCIAFTVESTEIREVLAKALRAEGVDCRPAVGGSFRLQPYGAAYRGAPTPNADHIHHTGMMLGCAGFEIYDKIEKAVAIMRRVL